MTWYQKEIVLSPKPRGFHLVTREIVSQVPQIRDFSIGLAHIFIQHSSAALVLNENADPDVRVDMEMALSRVVPQTLPYTHTLEGPDDMPAHVKCSLFGPSLVVPIADGRLCLGTWQGIYLCEHRDRAAGRSLVLTAMGQKR